MRTIWLASYPKSGNTWFRVVLSTLRGTDAKSVDINNLDSDGIASTRGPFDFLLMVDSGELTQDEIDNLRPEVYAELARGEYDEFYEDTKTPVRFVKVHDAYTLSPNGKPLMGGARGADGVIVIVRDPRDIVASLANHIGSNIDGAIDYMARNTIMSGRRRRHDKQFRQQLLTWSGHVASWLEQRDIPVHLMRYEDMIADPMGSFRRALAFAQYPAAEEDIIRAVRLADFSRLQDQEKETRFREAPGHLLKGKGNFFRQGQAGRWHEELTAEQVQRIEAQHAPMMRRLGYVPTQAATAATSGGAA